MDGTQSTSRATGIVAIVTGVAAVVLLLNHPGEQATDFAGLLKDEAANLTINAIVHGGYLFVLPLQIVCYAVLTGRIGFNRALAIAGLVFFATGAAIQMADLLVDGFMLPTIATRYLAAPPDRVLYARALFVLCETAIQFLLPLGIGFQAVGIAMWGSVSIRRVPWAGSAGITIGLLALAATIGAMVTGMQHLMLVAIVLLAIWALVAGLLLLRRTI